ncbi:MAG: hypothetical protein YYHSYBAR_000156 [Candidatus Fervidibacter sacchari]
MLLQLSQSHRLASGEEAAQKDLTACFVKVKGIETPKVSGALL